MDRVTAKNLLMATRPPTLLVGLAPVLIGNVLGLNAPAATHSSLPSWVIVLFSFLVVMLLQAGANLVNDLKDFERGADNDFRQGPVRAIQQGLLTPDLIQKAYQWFFGIAFILGLILTIDGGVLVLFLALACLGAAYGYTGGPFPLAYLALGELLALIFFGPVAVAGTEYLHTGIWRWSSCVWGLGPGFLAAALMAINNYRDRESDDHAGKKTLSLMLSEAQARFLPFLSLVLAMLTLFLYGALHLKLLLTIACTVSGLLFLSFAVKPLLVPYGSTLNRALKRTAIFSFVYAVMFALVVSL